MSGASIASQIPLVPYRDDHRSGGPSKGARHPTLASWRTHESAGGPGVAHSIVMLARVGVSQQRPGSHRARKRSFVSKSWPCRLGSSDLSHVYLSRQATAFASSSARAV
jgi:hypothetical protein